MNKPVIGVTTDIDGEQLKVNRDYCEAVDKAGGLPVLLPPIDDTEAYAATINGLIISGGADIDPSYYGEEILPAVKLGSRKRCDFEFSLLRTVLSHQKPVFGICYGMQLINVFFGGTLYQDIDAQVSVAINHGKDYHKIVIAENRLLGNGAFSVSSSHHQAIKALGKGLSAVAYSEDSLIEALTKEDYNFLIGVQWHPERSLEDELSMTLLKSFVRAARDFE